MKKTVKTEKTEQAVVVADKRLLAGAKLYAGKLLELVKATRAGKAIEETIKTVRASLRAWACKYTIAEMTSAFDAVMKPVLVAYFKKLPEANKKTGLGNQVRWERNLAVAKTRLLALCKDAKKSTGSGIQFSALVKAGERKTAAKQFAEVRGYCEKIRVATQLSNKELCEFLAAYIKHQLS